MLLFHKSSFKSGVKMQFFYSWQLFIKICLFPFVKCSKCYETSPKYPLDLDLPGGKLKCSKISKMTHTRMVQIGPFDNFEATTMFLLVLGSQKWSYL